MFSVYGIDGSWIENYYTIKELRGDLTSYTEEGSTVCVVKLGGQIVGSITTILHGQQYLITMVFLDEVTSISVDS